MESARPLFVLSQRFAIGRLETGRLVLDDTERGERLGLVISDLSEFLVELDGGEHIIFAGVLEPGDGPVHTVHLAVLEGGDIGFSRVGNGVWMTFPHPYEPGMRVTVTYRDADGNVVNKHTTSPLERRRLPPKGDPGWVAF